MPSVRPKTCKRCGANAYEGADISWRGLCAECSESAMVTNNAELIEANGLYFEHWRYQNAYVFRYVKLDERPQRP